MLPTLVRLRRPFLVGSMFFVACRVSDRQRDVVHSESRDEAAVASVESGVLTTYASPVGADSGAVTVDSSAAVLKADAEVAHPVSVVDAGFNRPFYDVVVLKDGRVSISIADVAGTLDCFRYYYGAGVRRDRPRARACFARDVAVDGACANDDGPFMPRIFLAVMEIEGQGGPVSRSEALALLEPCGNDYIIRTLRDAAQGSGSLLPDGGASDPCGDLPGDTFTIAQCVHMRKALHIGLQGDPSRRAGEAIPESGRF